MRVLGQRQVLDDPSMLAEQGALVEVEVFLPSVVRESFEREGRAVPPFQKAIAMIDTGASISGVRDEIAIAAGLVQTSSVRVSGVVGTEERPVYAAGLHLPEYGIGFDAVEVAGITLPQQEIQFLIGRDMLRKIGLLYNGPIGRFELREGEPDLMSTIVAGALAAGAFSSAFWWKKVF